MRSGENRSTPPTARVAAIASRRAGDLRSAPPAVRRARRRHPAGSRPPSPDRRRARRRRRRGPPRPHGRDAMPFRDHHPERLRLGAGVHDDVERAQRGGHVGDMAGEPDLSDSPRAATRAAARRATTGCRRSSYTAPPIDIGADRMIGREAAQSRRGRLRVPSIVRTSRRGRCAPGRRRAAGPRAPRGRAAGLPARRSAGSTALWMRRSGAAGPNATVASRSTLSEFATITSAREREGAQQPRRQRPAAHVFVQVPDEPGAGRLDQRRGDVRLEAVAVNDGRVGSPQDRSRSAAR